MTPSEQTSIACLTPPRRGAIATLAIRGPAAWSTARALFQPAAKPLPEQPGAGGFWFGRLGEDAKNGRDEVVLSVRRTDPTPWIELHCHGGVELVRLLLEVFAERGVQVCSWEELERHSGADPLASEARITLARAPTVRTAAIILDQFHGALARRVQSIRAAFQREQIGEAARLLQELRAYVSLGRHLVEPWRVVIAGAANVGKSSLINALAGFQRSVVDAAPGTTRDVVTTLTAIDGWPVELADTAGWRDRPEQLELAGLSLAREAIGQADLCLGVVDGSAPLLPNLPPGAHRYIINKIDLAPGWDWNDVSGAVRVSAKEGTNLKELCDSLSEWLVPDAPAAGTAIPFTPQLCDRIEEAGDLCDRKQTAQAVKLVENLLQEPLFT